MKVFAHRGYNAKDNTLEAFQNAIIEKFDYLEADIHRTADYDLVLHHDPIIGTHHIFLIGNNHMSIWCFD